MPPQLISMNKCSGNTVARRFDNMLGHGIGIEGR
jgi:hypothetical protein